MGKLTWQDAVADLKPPRISTPRGECRQRIRARPPVLRARAASADSNGNDEATPAKRASYVTKPRCIHGAEWNRCAECDPVTPHAIEAALSDIRRDMPAMEEQVNASLREAAIAHDEILRRSREAAASRRTTADFATNRSRSRR
jgi:hypothetical protein